jgi:hypothetical protein
MGGIEQKSSDCGIIFTIFINYRGFYSALPLSLRKIKPALWNNYS